MPGDHGHVEIALLDCELRFVFVASTEPVGGYKSGLFFMARRVCPTHRSPGGVPEFVRPPAC